MEAWRLYLDEFRRRGERASEQQVGRNELLGEAAHDAYQAAADRLTREHGWGDEETLTVMRGLNGVVKRWMQRSEGDWDTLGEELRRSELELRHGYGEAVGRGGAPGGPGQARGGSSEAPGDGAAGRGSEPGGVEESR